MNRHNISMNGLRVFETSARHLNFTAAAVELHITQAAVSQQVRTLESQLGAKLFSRQARRLELTQPGQELLACLLYTSPSPRDATLSRMPSSA